ncbi:endonuclease domain-containing protein [Robiginitomaculum antarcticum]|uniref:endonuclease domain-containing protein n=1 Tax=Robiginitomaculum antarcticum TaxID=437507 RepID=UPI000A06318A|nr:DUF559 domain-containing protein [Robiginitomaculum antarcticum]
MAALPCRTRSSLIWAGLQQLDRGAPPPSSSRGSDDTSPAKQGRKIRIDTKRSRQFAKHLRKNLTDAEVILWGELKSRRLQKHRFRRQHPIGPYITDFAHMKSRLVIEIDGATHSTDAELAHDLKRTDYMEGKGWRVIRVQNDDVYNHIDGVCDFILQNIE